MSLQSRINDLITAIGTDIKQHRTWITGSASGDLTGLTTTDKSSVVAAVNEVKAGSGSPADASDTVKGIVELATLAEVATGTDAVRAVTAAGVRQERTAIVALIPSAPADASETVKGIVELASLAEVATGTDALRAVTAAGLRQERTALKTEILGAGVPAALDTLDELAAALADDANYAATITTALGNKQPLDADLTAIGALVSAADKLPYSTGAGTWALAAFTAAGRTLVAGADAAAQRTSLSVYSQAELGNPETDLSALYTTAKS